MSEVQVPYPDYEDVMRESQEMADASPELVTYDEIGKSEEGRSMPMLTITDPSVPNEDKTVFLLSGGTDGNEEVGRAVALGLARTLLEPQNRTHLKRQAVLVVPVTNPDGAVRDQKDRYENSNGVNSSQVHASDPPATAEGRAMRGVAEEWIPDAHVDFHGLAGGDMGDCAFLYPTVNKKWSVPLLMEVYREIEDAGMKAGFCQQGWPRLWWEPRCNLPGWMARNYSSFCMVIEGTENYYPLEDSVRSGLARLLRLMEIGEQTRFFQTIPNYPCDVVSGNRMGALMPFGGNYTERRKSRRDMSQMIIQGVPYFGRATQDYDWTAEIVLPVEDTVTTFPEGMVFQATIDRRAEIEKVFWRDRELKDSEWTRWNSEMGVVVRAEIGDKPVKGKNSLKIKYRVPFTRHVEPKRAVHS